MQEGPLEFDITKPICIDQLAKRPVTKPIAPLKILMLADVDLPNSNVVDDINQFGNYSRHSFTTLSPLRWTARQDRQTDDDRAIWGTDFSQFDALMIHYSIYTLGQTFLPTELSRKIALFAGPKFQTIRDEFRFVNKIAAKMAYHGIDVLFSVLRASHIEEVYHHPELVGIWKISTLPGLAPEHLVERPVPPIRERPLHLTYRSRPLPPTVGSFGYEKVILGQRVAEEAAKHGLRVDISVKEEDRVYGEAWIELLTAGKAVLSAPGGSGIFDFTGEAFEAAKVYGQQHPDAHPLEVIKNALSRWDGNIVHKQPTPRTFEAIALRTPLVMPESDYRGVFEPWTHYIPIKPDLSNIETVSSYLKDDEFLEELAARTFDDIVVKRDYSRRAFVEKFDKVLDLLILSIRERIVHNRPARLQLHLLDERITEMERKRITEMERIVHNRPARLQLHLLDERIAEVERTIHDLEHKIDTGIARMNRLRDRVDKRMDRLKRRLDKIRMSRGESRAPRRRIVAAIATALGVLRRIVKRR